MSTARPRCASGTGSHGLPVDKAGSAASLLPDHRRAAAVAALEARPEADAVGIAQILEGEFGLLQPELLALIEADRAAQAGKQRDRELRRRVGSPPGLVQRVHMADDVMVGKRPADPAVGDRRLEGVDAFAHMGGGEIRAEQVESVAHVELVAAGRVGGDRLQRARAVADLADRGAVVIFVEQRAETLEETQVFRLRLVVQMVLVFVRIGLCRPSPPCSCASGGLLRSFRSWT